MRATETFRELGDTSNDLEVLGNWRESGGDRSIFA